MFIWVLKSTEFHLKHYEIPQPSAYEIPLESFKSQVFDKIIKFAPNTLRHGTFFVKIKGLKSAYLNI